MINLLTLVLYFTYCKCFAASHVPKRRLNSETNTWFRYLRTMIQRTYLSPYYKCTLAIPSLEPLVTFSHSALSSYQPIPVYHPPPPHETSQRNQNQANSQKYMQDKQVNLRQTVVPEKMPKIIMIPMQS